MEATVRIATMDARIVQSYSL